MKRNMELVRRILMKIESNPTGYAPDDFGIQSFSPQEVGYHAHIMQQEGLIEAIDVTSFESSGPEATPTKLTWKGHEFLDLARDPDRWGRAKWIVDRVGGAPISVWMKVLTDLMMERVERATARAS